MLTQERLMEIARTFKESLPDLSPESKRRYMRIVIDFLSYNSKELSEINGDDFQSYLSYKLNQGIGHPGYMKTKSALHHLKIFCLLNFPYGTQSVYEMRKPIPDSQILTQNERAIQQMRNAACNDLTGSAVFELCYCGVRTREFPILKRSDLDFVQSTLTITNGLNKRILPLTEQCIISLEQYLRFRMDSSEDLFLFKTAYNIRAIFKGLKKKANVKNVSPTFLRKTCGARLLSREDLPVSEVLKILDLRSINSEQIKLSLEYRTV